MEEIIKLLIINNKTIAAMESCTGGRITDAVTNVENASKVLKFSAVTYSNEYKIKMGVDSEIIDKYTVYSTETAMEMSKKISLFANSNYGIGITGTFVKNDYNVVYVSLYDRDNDKYYNDTLKFTSLNRKEGKEVVLNRIIEMVLSLLKKTNL